MEEQVRWSKQFAAEGSISFPASRAKMSLGLMGCLGFTAIGIWMCATGDLFLAAMGSVSIVFFGIICFPLVAWRWVTRRPIVRVDHNGVSSGGQHVLWAEVEEIFVWGMYRTSVVILRLTPGAAERISRDGGRGRRWLKGVNEQLVGPSTMDLPSGNGFDAKAMAAWLNSLRHSMQVHADMGGPGPGPGSEAPAEAGPPLVPDWPEAAVRPVTPPHPDRGFESEHAPPSAVGVLQWVSTLLVQGEAGQWDFINLHEWATGQRTEVMAALGTQGTSKVNLQQAVTHALGHPCNITQGTWAFAQDEDARWWTAPLFVVHDAD